MTADSKIEQAVNDRINIARQTWILINKKLIFSKKYQYPIKDKTI